MRVANPEWLLLLAVLAAAAWQWPSLGLRRPLRIACALLLTLILARPQWRLAGEGMDLWVVVDRSASAAEMLNKALPEWEALLQRGQGSSDRLHFIEFAGVPVRRGGGEITVHDVEESRIALAIEYTLAQMAPDRLSRMLLISDGYSTEPLTGILEPLRRSRVPLDYRLLVSPDAADVRVAAVQSPQRVQPGESFMVEAAVAGTQDGDCAYEVRRNDQVIGKGTVSIVQGAGRIRFTDRLRGSGGYRYGVRLLPQLDAHSQNNEGATWVEVTGGARVLLLSAFDQDPVGEVLTRSGFKVDQVTDPSTLHPGSLSGTRLVILNNVPAHLLPQEFVRTLDFFVREQGGSVLMGGGRFSFGSGGYFASPLDPLLPVSMELRKEHRKLRVAMSIVMDRSGSMGVSVSAGGGTVTKMELADEGAARAIELLGDSDLISVFAVDSEAHSVVPLSEVGPSRSKILDRVRRIRSEGGGIFVYNGLEAGWAELKKADVGQRHIILFADASDSEEPGAFRKLLEEITKEGATVSVIGMGTPKDSDAALLQEIAHLGKGRMLFNANAAELPGLFAQETVAVARSAFINEATPLKATAGWLEMAATPLSWPAAVDGFNLSYLKPGATAASLTGDEYGAPLVAFWQRGLGRSAAVTFPLAGDFSAGARSWPQYADLLTTLARWLSGEDAPSGLGLASQVSGTRLQLNLFYDEQWVTRLAADQPRLVLSGPEESRHIAWTRLAPGHFRAETSLRPGELIRGAVQLGRVALPFGPIAASGSAEWQFNSEAVRELQALATQTGGQERLDLASSWETPSQERFSDLRLWLLAVLLVLVVADAFATRTGRGEARAARL